jgi:hypothetical protein
VESLVSTDIVVEASATLIAGMIFLVTVRQALKLPDVEFYAKSVSVGIVIFILAIGAATLEDLEPSWWQWPKLATWVLFFFGLVWLA